MLTYFVDILAGFAFQKVLSAVILAIVCLAAIKLILKIYDKVIVKSKLDELIRNPLRIALKALLLFLSLIIVLPSLGISVTSLVATLSVVGVAFSLAIQGFLTNVFGGIQIISNKPFHVGDFVEAGGQSGVVQEVGLFYTKLHTTDKKLVQIPNSSIANANIVNYSSSPNRRVDLLFTASYDAPVEKVEQVLLEVIANHPKTIQDPAPFARVSNYGASSIEYTVRGWCANADYWDVYFDVMKEVKIAFDRNGIEMTYDHLNVHVVKE